MINEMKPLTMAEVKEISEDVEEDKGIKDFIKKFTKLDAKTAIEMREEIEKLGILKVKDGEIVKIVDLMPEDATDLNKIFTEVSLDEEEIKKILEVVKKYK
ncbi:hypothetical protein HYW76_05225 [Candidatus Pacearchaeota archaeon]|nr:hypothetical protein [Candidatus Pacearchaeota archaeon]